jgi:hypothetical protein
VHKNQHGLIKNKTIHDCLAWSFEYLYLFHKSKKEIVILKIDFDKLFDKVEYNVIPAMLKHLGFGQKFIDWVKHISHGATSVCPVNWCSWKKYPPQ